MKKISVIFGTRPEAIKLAPVILALRRERGIRVQVCVTAQHRGMLDQVLRVFELTPDEDLGLMRPDQQLAEFSARALVAVDGHLERCKPDLVLVQGDTTTAFCAALAAFYRRIPVAHVEAGLRSGNLQAPWPEEANRVMISRLAALHFAPTVNNRRNLLKAGVPSADIEVTGNTAVDAVLLALERIRTAPPVIKGLPVPLQPAATDGPRLVLVTGHRRESFGKGLEDICRAVATLAERFADTHFVYPVHLNPRVQDPVNRLLRPLTRRGNLHLIEPQDYLSFVALMHRAHLILTDSGGVQEEAPSLGRPVLVLREVTERTEVIRAGAARLVGTDPARIVREADALLSSPRRYQAMCGRKNPYGDGRAAARMVARVKAFLDAR